jgi:O-antigen/teichoic acid export membrane protein
MRLGSANLALLLNSGALFGTTVVNSGLGFAYWWTAAHLFSPEAVGLASAAVSAMMLLGNVGLMGLGTWLIGELARHPDRAPELTVAVMGIAGSLASALGMGLALLAPRVAPGLSAFATSPGSVALFSLGVGLYAASLAFDQACVGMLRGRVQLGRNALFALAKLLALVAVGLWRIGGGGRAIYSTWTAGMAVSLLVIAAASAPRGMRLAWRKPQWSALRRIGGSAMLHQALNLALDTPGLLLPLIVTSLLSVRLNAGFYVAWMVASLVFAVPAALGTVLYAIGTAGPDQLAARLRLSLSVSLGVSVAAIGMLALVARPLLQLFGSTYADQATTSLRILACGALPLAIKAHYVTICRVRQHLASAALAAAAAGAVEIGCAALGAALGGLSGLSLGWVVALTLEAAGMAPTVLRAHGWGVRLPLPWRS